MSGRRDSNPRPSAWKANALSTELLPQICGGQGWIRTTEGVSQQIYSLPHLATLVLAQQNFKKRAEDGTQTRDPQLGRLMLYQLSYFRKFGGQRWIRTTEGVSQQIYSLPHLATLVFARPQLRLVLFSIALQRYDYFFNLQTKSIIFIAVTAHSSPLFPNLPPARSSACCMLLVVIKP